MPTWVVEGEQITAELTRFEDITAGDEIVHLYLDPDGEVMLWVGVVLNRSRNGFEWYGKERKFTQSQGYHNPQFGEFVVNSGDDVLVVANWHADEPGHSIYKVTA